MTCFVEVISLIESFFYNNFGDYEMSLNVGVYVKSNILILRLNGDLDDITVPDLRKRISTYIDEYKIMHLVINFEKLDFIDSSGIGFIIGRFHQLRKKNGDVTLCGIQSKLEKIINVSGLSKICIIRENEKAVLISMGEYINA